MRQKDSIVHGSFSLPFDKLRTGGSMVLLFFCFSFFALAERKKRKQ